MERPDFQKPRKVVNDDIIEDNLMRMNDIITVAGSGVGQGDVAGSPLLEPEENMGMFTLGPSKSDPFQLHLEDGNIPVIQIDVDPHQMPGNFNAWLFGDLK